MILMREIWKPVKGYEEIYEVSNTGEVKRKKRIVRGGNNLRTLQERKLSKISTSEGYFSVALSNNGKTRNAYVHRLVAEAFLDNPENKPCVNHIDYDRKNNNVENLE